MIEDDDMSGPALPAGVPEYNRLGPMRMTPERVAALDAMWREHDMLRQREPVRWMSLYQQEFEFEFESQGWVCPDCRNGKHDCRQPIYDRSMENRDRCVCCGEERDGRD